MEPQQVERLILAQDWSVLDHIGGLGQDALPLLTRLMKNPDPQVRQLVVLCLEHVDGPGAADLLTEAVNDPDEQVRAYAADMLLASPHPSILPAIQVEVSRHEDPRIRSKAALLVGLLGGGRSLGILREALESEADDGVRSSLEQALARLGDPHARGAIVVQLRSPDKKAQFQALENIEYVGDGALVREVAWLLSDSSPVTVLMDAGTAKVVLRTQDAAAKVIAQLLGQPFSFRLASYRVCTDAELQEVRAYLRARGIFD